MWPCEQYGHLHILLGCAWDGRDSVSESRMKMGAYIVFGKPEKNSEIFWRTRDTDLPTFDKASCLAIRDPEKMFFSG